jgi:carboxypeptidase C (cathepsin A)
MPRCRRPIAQLAVLAALACHSLQAQEPRARADTTRAASESPAPVTRHRITVNGEAIAYTAKAGMMPIRNAQTGNVEGNIFYVYYKRDGGNATTRPISFIFNGGPGSSTVWLHLGAFGPKIVRLNADGTNLTPPYTLKENEHTLLDQTDLVFLDPVGTGYSRATKPEFGPNFWGLDEDVRAVGEFVRMFLTREQRWASPKFVGGESYGTTRAAHLSGWLVDNGIALNGIMLISTVLNFQASRQANGNDLGWVGYFPTYTATAWYHRKLPADLQAQPLPQVLRQVERWVDSTYLVALHAGNRLTPAARQRVAGDIARFTGLSREFVEQNDLRITLGEFVQELLKNDRKRVGRLDSRFTAFISDPGDAQSGFDPSEASIRNSFTSVLNDYMRGELNYFNDDVYYILGGGIGPWRYQGGSYPDVTPSLERAFAKNPAMHVYVASGFYDGATPYWAVEYTLAHLRIAPEARQNIVVDYFDAGHMMYIEAASMAKLRDGIRRFMQSSISPPRT